jgi:Lon protease (S16) C-terminal proteolytic domain
MLFKHKHLLAELRKNGRRATAEIISVKTVGEGSSIRALWAPDEDPGSGWIDCLMRLRVVPEHGLVRTEVAVTGALTVAGELLPVRGFREKAHCAKRGYAQLLVAPKANEPDVHQVSQQDRRDLQLAFAATPAEAIYTALAGRFGP